MSRRPLESPALQAQLPPRWARIDVVEVATSTNAEVLADPPGAPLRVLVAEQQSVGRGRLDRGWDSPPRAGLLFSARLRPTVAPATWGWLPLLTGVAVAEAVAGVSGVPTALKWPNDVLAGASGGKLAGILVQTAGADVVVGVGLNVDTTRAELPVDTATSLALAGADDVDRTVLLAAVLAALDRRLDAWAAAGGDAARSGLAGDYRGHCATIGREVHVTIEGAAPLDGTAVDVDDAGRLVLDTATGPAHVAAGDVTHVRPVADR